MDLLDRETLVSLARPTGWPSISLYLPTHKTTAGAPENRIRMKNLIRVACARLVEEGMREPDAEQFCGELRAILEDDSFWVRTGDGLAAFVHSGGTRVFRLDAHMPEHVVVGDRLYLRPLLHAYRTDETFYALALDKNKTRLFRGDHTSVEEVPLPEGTPVTFEDAMKYDEAEANLTTASFAPSRISSRGRQHGGSVYAGYGGEKDVANEHTDRYARMVERGVAEVLKNERAPLVILGIERQLASYRTVNTYEHLVEPQVLGASDYYTPQAVHKLATETLAPHFAAQTDADLARLADREGSALASHDLSEIVSAAATGRVDTLLFDTGTGPFGTFDRDTLEVRQVCDDMPRMLRETGDTEAPANGGCGWDLIDLAAAETVLHGGEVRAFTGESAPVRGAAAILRY